jgi:hypothetical protein
LNKDGSGFYKDRVYYRIRFSAIEFRKLYDLLKPFFKYIPTEFAYKFNMKYVPNRVSESLYLSENYNFENIL